MICQHPGEFIEQVLTATFGIDWVSVDRAHDIGISVADFNNVVFHYEALQPALAEKFARYIGITPDFLMSMQRKHEEAI